MNLSIPAFGTALVTAFAISAMERASSESQHDVKARVLCDSHRAAQAGVRGLGRIADITITAQDTGEPGGAAFHCHIPSAF